MSRAKPVDVIFLILVVILSSCSSEQQVQGKYIYTLESNDEAGEERVIRYKILMK